MHLRGLAVLVWALGEQGDTHPDESFAFVFIERSLQCMAAQLEAGPDKTYRLTVDPEAVA